MTREIKLSRLHLQWPLYLFLLPSVLLVAVFSYYPAISAVIHSFYEWNMDTVRNFYGMTHFNRLLGQPLAFVVSAATIFALLATGRSSSVYARYARLFGGIVIPAIALAWMSVTIGTTAGSASTNGTIATFILLGLPILLVSRKVDRLDPAKPVFVFVLGSLFIISILLNIGATPQLAWLIVTTVAFIVSTRLPALTQHRQASVIAAFTAMTSMAVVLWTLAAYGGGDSTLWHGFSVILILVVANVFKMIPSIITAVIIHRLRSERANYWYKVLFVIPMIIPFTVSLLIWKFFFQPNGIFNMVLEHSGLSQILAWMDVLFGWGGALFSEGQPALWLGSPDLVIPALIIWGFPWVSTIGVLIFLAGLQSIDTSIYEAGDVDGISAIGKFLYIELPLILTQVRINLVLMIIGTLQSYGTILMLFGDSGGPNGQLMIPGLYMFRSAFVVGAAGKACAIGLILFVLILMLTELNNRYIRVNK